MFNDAKKNKSCLEVGERQGFALPSVWMVERIARTVHGRSIRQVAHVVGEVRTGQRRTSGTK